MRQSLRTISGQAWPTALFTVPGRVIVPSTRVPIQLDPGDGRTGAVCVTIPITVAGGALDLTDFRARAQTEPAVTATAPLTTPANCTLYLPEVQKLNAGLVSLP